MTTKRQRTAQDIRDAPAYTFAEAARYLQVPAPTVRIWVVGLESELQRFRPLIHRPDPNDKRLSFNNLVEIHVLRALRTKYDVSMAGVRKALRYAEERCGIARLLIHRDLRTSTGEIFLEKYSNLISLTKGGQLALRNVLSAHLQRVVYDPKGVPIRLYPWIPNPSEAPRMTIVLDPQISFGNPVTEHRGISTAVLASRYDAGEKVEDLVADYGLESREVVDAIQFERAV